MRLRHDVIGRILARSVEAVLSVAVAMGFFVLMLGLLTYLFPLGTGLGTFASYQSLMEEDRDQLAFQFEKEERAAEAVAVLTEIRRKVKDKPASGIAWADSTEGSLLRNRHAIQTFDRSSATVVFGDRHSLRLKENTLVVIKSLDADDRGETRKASLIVMDGEMSAEIGRDGERFEVEVATASGTTRVASPDRKGETAFNVTVNKDRSSTFTVSEGAAEITAEGETVKLQANQAVTVAAAEPPGEVVVLPPPPRGIEPEEETVYHYRSRPPRVLFRWEGEEACDSYRFELARDEGFTDMVRREKLRKTELIHGNLKQGEYHWRVTCTRDGVDSLSGKPGMFRLEKDPEAPELDVTFGKPSATGEMAISGRTEPGSRVFIADSAVAVDDSGGFRHVMRLDRGLNVVVVEVVDQAGNTSYRSEIVNAKY